jgi:DivIVA domain-containing protein
MPLTPEDVHKKTFTPVRLREGYDMAEVDQFLDEVEAELIRLIHDNDDLRSRGGAPGAADAAGSGEPVSSESTQHEAGPSNAPATTPAEASSRAARLLEIAANNADQLVGEAREEADKVLSEARALAERLESDARTRAEKLDAETSERRNQLFGELEEEKGALARSLDELRSLEQDFRSRLKGFFEAQLQVLDGNPDGHVAGSMLSDLETPPRLRELLGEEAG